jgi:pilus assembly protein CpaE
VASPAAPDTVPFVPRPARPGDGRVIAVMAGKGGSGKTVVATNLAVALGMRGDTERIAIVDADLQFGDVALLLQIDPVRTLDDLVGRLDSMSDERLDAALLRHESGIRVLPAPILPVKDGDINAKQIVEVVDRLKSMYDYIIVDTGPVFDDGLVTILDYADEVISVVDMDLPSVKNAKVALDRLRQGGFDVERVRLVVNRVNSKARLDLVELERSLGLRVGGSVPSDRLVPQSVNEGIPVLALSPRSKVARAFHALAESLDSDAERDRLNRR